jgi:predicted  nucleic acid-binding Zn-ribbon protein
MADQRWSAAFLWQADSADPARESANSVDLPPVSPIIHPVTRISSLFRLQNLDSQLDARNARLAEIRLILSRNPELEKAQSEETEACQLQEACRLALRKAEEETRHQQQRISDTDAMLYSGTVRNPKELQDLEAEAASLRRFLTTLEERQLQAMMAAEESESAVSAARECCRKLERDRAALSETLSAERTGLESEVDKLSAQREAAVAAVSPADLELYQSLRKSKRGLAVVRLEAEACAGCGVSPSSARVDSARSGQDIVQCGNCGRILYLG